MKITRRRLVKELGISGAVLSSTGCLGSTAPNETPNGTNTTKETLKPAETPTTTVGWASEIPESPPSVSCSAASRPVTEPVDREEALAPRKYPGRPPSKPAGEPAAEYATTFELAYRQNAEMRANTDVSTDDGPDKYLIRFDISVQDSWVAAGPSDSAVVRLKYVGSGTVHPGMDFDYVTQYVTYYIDSTRIVRAKTTQYDFAGADTLDPNPWTDGDLVACFET